MKIYKSLDELEEKLVEIINNTSSHKAKSITRYEYLANIWRIFGEYLLQYF